MKSPIHRALLGTTLVVFVAALAGLATALTLGFADIQPFLPVGLLLAVTATALAGWYLVMLSERGVVLLFVIAVVLIDLGFGRWRMAGLSLKGLAYTLCVVACLPWLARNLAQISGLTAVSLAYLSLAGISIAYSAEPLTSLQTFFGLAALVLAAVRLRHTASVDERALMLRSGARLFALMSFASVVMYLVLPSWVIDVNTAGGGRVFGFYGSPNSAGGFAGLGLVLNAVMLAWPGNDRRWARLVVTPGCLLACAAFLAVSGSRNGMITTATALVLVAWLRWSRPVVFLLGCSLIVVFVLTILDLWGPLVDSVLQFMSRERSGSDVKSLTGRVPIWQYAAQEFWRAPWFGNGLAATRTVVSQGFRTFWGQTFTTAHNALLESLLDLGIVGTVVLAVMVAWIGAISMRKALRLRSAPQDAACAVAAAGVVCFVLVFGFAEKSFAGSASTATGALLMALVWAVPPAERRPRAAQWHISSGERLSRVPRTRGMNIKPGIGCL